MDSLGYVMLYLRCELAEGGHQEAEVRPHNGEEDDAMAPPTNLSPTLTTLAPLALTSSLTTCP
jgi:hypothetical protein